MLLFLLCYIHYLLFALVFHSTGLKESFLTMLVVLFFNYYYKYLKQKNISHLNDVVIANTIIDIYKLRNR
jgi:hypothetical protein